MEDLKLDCTIEKVNLDKESPKIEKIVLENPKLERIIFENPKIEKVVFENPNLEKVVLETPNTEKIDLEKVIFENSNIENIISERHRSKSGKKKGNIFLEKEHNLEKSPSLEKEPNLEKKYHDKKDSIVSGNILGNDVLTFLNNSINEGLVVLPEYLKGPPGLQGEQGVAGPQGIQGIQGTQGLQGIQGVPGPVGPKGIQGDIGPIGHIGPCGPQGPRGLQGLQGIQGIQGPIGPQGPSGLQGIQGQDGAQGPIGPSGPSGPPGATVLSGLTDVQITGLTGHTGNTSNLVDLMYYNGTKWVNSPFQDFFPYGEIHYNPALGTITTINIVTANTFELLNPITTLNTLSRFFDSPSEGRLRYIGTRNLIFRICSVVSGKNNSGTSRRWYTHIRKNGTFINGSQSHFSGPNDTLNGGGFCISNQVIVDLVTNDYVEIYITNAVNNTDFDIYYLNLQGFGFNP